MRSATTLVRAWILCLLLLNDGPVFGAAEGPQATESPQQAVKALLAAIRAGDQKKALESVVIAPGREGESESAKAVLKFLIQPQRLYNAVKRKFGENADGLESLPFANEFQMYLKSLDERIAKATVRAEGDVATVVLPKKNEEWELLNPFERSIALAKTEAGWRIDLNKTMGIKGLSELSNDPRFAEMSNRVRVLGEFADAVEKGRFKDFQSFVKLLEDWQDGEVKEPFKEQ